MACGDQGFCETCPLVELSGGDQFDGINSVVILRGLMNGRKERFYRDESDILQNFVRREAGYSNKEVSSLAILALENWLAGKCDK